MPSTATITAFYNFTANTKARASQVTNNFDQFRGHLVPVEVLTATASNLVYSLGSPDHRWLKTYSSELNVGHTTTSWRAYDDATAGGNLVLSLNGTDKYTFESAAFRSATNLSIDLGSSSRRWNNLYAKTIRLGETQTAWFIYNDLTSGGNLVFEINGVNGLLINGSGPLTATVNRIALRPRAISYAGTDPSYEGICFSPGTTGARDLMTLTVTAIPDSTATLSRAQGPVEIGIFPKNAASAVSYINLKSTNGANQNAQVALSMTLFRYQSAVETPIHAGYWEISMGNTTSSTIFDHMIKWPLPGYFAIDDSCASGPASYYLKAYVIRETTTSTVVCNMNNWRVMAKEMF